MFSAIELAGVSYINSAALYPAQHRLGAKGLPLLEVNNQYGRAIIALQGAQVLSWQPAGREEMLWLSPCSHMETGKAIRGGIPLCMPWFGPAADGSLQHGFARIMDWTLVIAEAVADGSTHLTLELVSPHPLHPIWPHAFRFRLDVWVGDSLRLTLSAENLSSETAPYGALFHTYFSVPDVHRVRVAGLEQTCYIDKLDVSRIKQQAGVMMIQEETDRIYLDVPAVQVLHSMAGAVQIESNAKCCVVWNAGDNDKNIADLGEGNHAGYLCIERGDVADYAVNLAPGATHEIRMKLSGLGTHALRGSARFHRQA